MNMKNVNFKELLNGILHSACVISVQKLNDGYGEIRIVDGNSAYLESFKGEGYFKHEFIPNSIYTDYLMKNLNFEDYCFRTAVKKEMLHSYAYPEYFKSWMHMLFIPIDYETEELAYCLYIMEINNEFNPELLANPRGDIYSKVLNTTLQLAQAGDFNQSLKNVTREIRKICNALFACILLVDEENEKISVLAEDSEPNSDRKTMKEYMDESFKRIVKSWDGLIASNGNCVIINDEKGMEYIKERNHEWYDSLTKNDIKSLVLFRLKTGNTHLGYMWVSNFKADDTTQIKEALEITTFVLGTEIGNHILLDRLEKLSSVDMLTGLYNRNKLNNYMNEIVSLPNTRTALIFMDINGLKKINDNEGHIAGDNLIRRAANTLISVFNDQDIFRVGGDEFVVILRDTDEKQINNYIDKLHVKAKKNDVSFAVGYAITDSPKDIEKILKEADVNMYQDKRKFYKNN